MSLCGSLGSLLWITSCDAHKPLIADVVAYPTPSLPLPGEMDLPGDTSSAAVVNRPIYPDDLAWRDIHIARLLGFSFRLSDGCVLLRIPLLDGEMADGRHRALPLVACDRLWTGHVTGLCSQPHNTRCEILGEMRKRIVHYIPNQGARQLSKQ